MAFSDRHLEAGEEVETKSWPHPSMIGLNESGRAVLAYYKEHQKSRLPISPWRDGRIQLADGLEGRGPVLPLKTYRAPDGGDAAA